MLMKVIVLFLSVCLLTGCGISKGDSVVVLPNDSPYRSSEIIGVFEQIDGDKTVVSNARGELLSFKSNEVFASDDSDAQALIKARHGFLNFIRSNYMISS